MQTWRDRRLGFYSKEIKLKDLCRFTEWIYKSTKDLSFSLIIHKIKVGSKLDLKKLMFYLLF